MLEETVEFFTAFKYHVRAAIFFYLVRPIASQVNNTLPETLPDRDKDLQLVKYSQVISTAKGVNASLGDRFVKDEGYKYSILSFIGRFSSSQPQTERYVLKNSTTTEQAYNKYIAPKQTVEQPLFATDLLHESICIQEGGFFGNLKPEGDYLVIDSLFMTKYKYKPNVLVPAVKAYFTVQNDKRIRLEKILHNGTVYHPGRRSPGFRLAKRLLFNYLLIKSILSTHLVVCHLKITQTCAFSVRKFLSSNNKMKQFLWNFTSGVIGTNRNTGNLIKLNTGSVNYFSPFSDEGIIDYINDSVHEDCSKYIFPQEQPYPCQTFSECETVYDIYKRYIREILQDLNKQELDECTELYDYLRLTVSEFKHKHIEEVLASFIFTASVLHDLTTKFYQQMIQGYDCPTSINTDGSVHKYRYLLSMLALEFVNLPQRKIFTPLPDTYDAFVRNTYDDMCQELLNQPFKQIDISTIDSAVQK